MPHFFPRLKDKDKDIIITVARQKIIIPSAEKKWDAVAYVWVIVRFIFLRLSPLLYFIYGGFLIKKKLIKIKAT